MIEQAQKLLKIQRAEYEEISKLMDKTIVIYNGFAYVPSFSFSDTQNFLKHLQKEDTKSPLRYLKLNKESFEFIEEITVDKILTDSNISKVLKEQI